MNFFSLFAQTNLHSRLHKIEKKKAALMVERKKLKEKALLLQAEYDSVVQQLREHVQNSPVGTVQKPASFPAQNIAPKGVKAETVFGIPKGSN